MTDRKQQPRLIIDLPFEEALERLARVRPEDIPPRPKKPPMEHRRIKPKD